MEKQKVKKEVMNALEKEVRRIGTMYFVWQSKEVDEKENVDVYFSEGATKEDLLKMAKFMQCAVEHWVKEHK